MLVCLSKYQFDRGDFLFFEVACMPIKAQSTNILSNIKPRFPFYQTAIYRANYSFYERFNESKRNSKGKRNLTHAQSSLLILEAEWQPPNKMACDVCI